MHPDEEDACRLCDGFPCNLKHRLSTKLRICNESDNWFDIPHNHTTTKEHPLTPECYNYFLYHHKVKVVTVS